MAKKNMAIALILSFFIPGLGLIYDEDSKKGLIYLIIFIILAAIGVYITTAGLAEDWESTLVVVNYSAIIVWILSLYDTFATTRNINM